MTVEHTTKIATGIRELADTLKAGFTIDKTGAVTVAEGLYANNLPEGLTMEVVESVHTHDANFASAAGLAFGEVSIDAMKKHASIDSTGADVMMTGKDKLSLNVRRKVETRAPGSTDPVISYGVLEASIDRYEPTSKRGDLKAVRTFLKESALAALGG